MSTDRDGETLLFGAGFAFGVTVTLVILALVLVVVRSGGPPLVTSGAGTTLAITAVSGALFAAIVGVALYYLAFPEHRTKIPIDADQFDRERDDVDGK